MDSISIDGMEWGESELMEQSHGKSEYVAHFTHSEGFSVHALQEAIEDHDEFVEYTYVDDPDEDAREYALYCQMATEYAKEIHPP